MNKTTLDAWENLTVRLRGMPLNRVDLRPGERLGTMIETLGELPENADAALATINAALPSAAPKLSVNDVYYHTVEAANNSYIPSYFMFLDGTTLANIATAGQSGFAFMTRHNTGDLFTSGELPYGRTVAGRYEQGVSDSGQLTERALLGFYMLRDHAPNGAGAINTDQLQKGILGGTIFDTSLGLRSDGYGATLCNVCSRPYGDCDHIRGYNYGMSLDEQVYARDVLGVPGGVATIRLVNWTANEVSAVYDGAVAGAGF